MSPRSARNFRNTNVQLLVGEELESGIWYRTPLSDSDHVLGLVPNLMDENDAWCGRALGVARDWVDVSYGGLWYSQRTSSKCAECARRQIEWDAVQDDTQ